ncbi:hypothetical protein [Listeria immobilis]|nr:hypothetical protein [Listeria immobilis]
MRMNHGYEIYTKSGGKKNVVKVGISAGRLNKNGSSRRANKQVRKWNKQAGYEKYKSRVVQKKLKGRSKALRWEQGHVNRVYLKKAKLNKHRRPTPQKWRWY